MTPIHGPGRRWPKTFVAAFALVAGIGTGYLTIAADPASAECSSYPTTYDPYVVQTVYRVGRNLGVSEKVMLAGFEAGWVESRMNNLDCGDRDSLGVFQQRPSQGWGTPEQIMNVRYAATRFFTPAMTVAVQHPTYTAGQIAQAVQISAFPERYDQAQGTALSLIAVAKKLGTPARDFDGDGRADFLARRADSGNLYLYRGSGSGGISSYLLLGNFSAFDIIVPVGDFNRDGHADLVARRGDSGNLYLYRGNGAGGLWAAVQIASNWGGFSSLIGVGDWDGDGKVDLVGRSRASGILYLYRGNGSNGFHSFVTLSSSNWSIFSHLSGAGDFDGDGNPDLIARRGDSGNVYLYRGGDLGGLQPATLLGNWGTINSMVGGGDFTNDGRTDVITRSVASSLLYLYRGNGSGGVLAQVQFSNGNWSNFNLIS